MYFIVGLRLKNEAKKNVWIPAHWCMGFNMSSVYNNGIVKTEDLTIFYSKNKKKVPNFSLKLMDEFVTEDACYIARFKSCKGKLTEFFSFFSVDLKSTFIRR